VSGRVHLTLNKKPRLGLGTEVSRESFPETKNNFICPTANRRVRHRHQTVCLTVHRARRVRVNRLEELERVSANAVSAEATEES